MIWILALLLPLVPSVLSCGGTIRLKYGQTKKIQSDGESIPFVDVGTCKWRVKGPNMSHIKIKCPTVKLHDSNLCRKTFLKINGNKFCGETSIEETIIEKSVTRVIFKTKKSGTRNKQFDCRVSAISKPTLPPVTTPVTVTTASPQLECGKKNNARIVGGGVTDLHEYPWQVRLSINTNSGSYMCGASLISSNWVLTAAHCADINGIRIRYIETTLGDHKVNNVESLTEVIRVKTIIVHPSYNSSTYDNDIALLELVSEVTLNPQAIYPVCLPFGFEDFDISGKTGTVTGWGTTSSGGSTSNVLLEVDVPLLTTEECQSDAYVYGDQITDNMICAGIPGKDSCQGDSGGPLFYENENENNFQLGVVSWGINCAANRKPGVYTKLINYLQWITSNTNIADNSDQILT